ncbi:universal stress protein [Cohnella candidum]|uniref:Universal stress protein n=1 Tax=Cohnella candidum TaxID=2674991 RepID=A0A3G3JZP0_9BACL|nr:universal stress protein [Cohnella candidum]AYQ72959.1 universal stress protein [Cohnella candidum]
MIYHHLLAAYDGSASADRALDQAVKLTDRTPGSKLTVVHVLHRPMLVIDGFGWAVPESYLLKLRENEDALLMEAERKIAVLPYSRVAVLSGSPASAILKYASENLCDLIVLGSRGLGSFQEWMLGSVSHQVAQQSRVPVLIVK